MEKYQVKRLRWADRQRYREWWSKRKRQFNVWLQPSQNKRDNSKKKKEEAFIVWHLEWKEYFVSNDSKFLDSRPSWTFLRLCWASWMFKKSDPFDANKTGPSGLIEILKSRAKSATAQSGIRRRTQVGKNWISSTNVVLLPRGSVHVTTNSWV